MSPRVIRISSAACGVLGAFYLVAGYLRLAMQDDLSDFQQRVNGLSLIRHGSTPYTLDRIAVADAPWAWLGNLVIYWPPRYERIYYAALMLGVTLLLATFAYREGERVRVGGGRLLAAAVLASSSLVTALGLGQNSPFIVAALVACYLLLNRGHRVLAGLCLGFALAKPQISLLFTVPLLVTGEFVALAVAAAYAASAMLIVCAMTGLTPVALFGDWQRYIASIEWPGYGPYQLLIDAGLPERDVLLGSALVFGGVAMTVIAILRQRPLLVLFAIAAAAGRLWSYHQLYDNLMIVFLLIATGTQMLRSDRPQPAVLFVLVGLTLWLPGRVCDWPVFQWFQMTVWVGAAVAVAATSYRRAVDHWNDGPQATPA